MLDPRQDRALQDLARSIAGSVDALGGSCTARLLARIALGLVDPADQMSCQHLQANQRDSKPVPRA